MTSLKTQYLLLRPSVCSNCSKLCPFLCTYLRSSACLQPCLAPSRQADLLERFVAVNPGYLPMATRAKQGVALTLSCYPNGMWPGHFFPGFWVPQLIQSYYETGKICIVCEKGIPEDSSEERETNSLSMPC